MEDLVVAVDPGRDKCGLAVISRSRGVLFRKIAETAAVDTELKSLVEQFSPEAILLGGGTFSKKVHQQIRGVAQKTPVKVVDEKHSTERARAKYFADNPPRGFWRYIPLTLQVPPKPYDDYAAIVLAEMYFKEGGLADGNA